MSPQQISFTFSMGAIIYYYYYCFIYCYGNLIILCTSCFIFADLSMQNNPHKLVKRHIRWCDLMTKKPLLWWLLLYAKFASQDLCLHAGKVIVIMINILQLIIMLQMTQDDSTFWCSYGILGGHISHSIQATIEHENELTSLHCIVPDMVFSWLVLTQTGDTFSDLSVVVPFPQANSIWFPFLAGKHTMWYTCIYYF